MIEFYAQDLSAKKLMEPEQQASGTPAERRHEKQNTEQSPEKDLRTRLTEEAIDAYKHKSSSASGNQQSPSIIEGLKKINDYLKNDSSKDEIVQKYFGDKGQVKDISEKKDFTGRVDEKRSELKKLLIDRMNEQPNYADFPGGSGRMDVAEKPVNSEPTQEDRDRAAKKLEKGISRLIPQQERELLINMQKAILNGDLAAFERQIKSLAGKPELLEKFVEELDKQLKTAGVRVALSDEGKVLIYKEGGTHCLEISPSGERTRIRPISHKHDGTVVMEPGTVIGKKAGDVLKDIGSHAVNDLTGFSASRLFQRNETPLQPHVTIPPAEYPGLKPLPGFPKDPIDLPGYYRPLPWFPKDPSDLPSYFKPTLPPKFNPEEPSFRLFGRTFGNVIEERQSSGESSSSSKMVPTREAQPAEKSLAK